MERSNDFRDVIQNTQEPAAYQEENRDKKSASLHAPEFQMKMNPVQKMEEEEEMQQKRNPVQKQEEEEEMMPKMNPVQKMEEEEEMQQKRSSNKPYQIKAKEVEAASTGVASAIPTQLKESMEHSLGGDFSNTQIYTNSEKATKMGALAYAQGNEIHFAPGKFNPDTKGGKELLGHELTHIVQQKKGVVQKTKKDRGMMVNSEFKLEKEADDMGKKAADSSFEDAPRRPDQSYEQYIKDKDGDSKSGDSKSGDLE